MPMHCMTNCSYQTFIFWPEIYSECAIELCNFFALKWSCCWKNRQIEILQIRYEILWSLMPICRFRNMKTWNWMVWVLSEEAKLLIQLQKISPYCLYATKSSFIWLHDNFLLLLGDQRDGTQLKMVHYRLILFSQWRILQFQLPKAFHLVYLYRRSFGCSVSVSLNLLRIETFFVTCLH